MFQELSRKTHTQKEKKNKGYNHGLGGEGHVRLEATLGAEGSNLHLLAFSLQIPPHVGFIQGVQIKMASSQHHYLAHTSKVTDNGIPNNRKAPLSTLLNASSIISN